MILDISNTDIFLITFCIVISLIILLSFVFILIERHIIKQVKKISPYYRYIKYIYDHADFEETDKNYSVLNRTVNSKWEYDRFIFNLALNNYIEQNLDAFNKIVNTIEHNEKQLSSYKYYIDWEPHTRDKKLAKSIHISLARMVRIEKLLAKRIVFKPELGYKTKIIVSYKPYNGRRHKKSHTFNYDYIKQIVLKLNEKRNPKPTKRKPTKRQNTNRNKYTKKQTFNFDDDVKTLTINND